MAKGFIDPPKEEEGNVNWTSQSAEQTRQTSQEGSQSEDRRQNVLSASTPENQLSNTGSNNSPEEVGQPSTSSPVTPIHQELSATSSPLPSPPLSPLPSNQHPSSLPSHPSPLPSSIPSPPSSLSSSPAYPPSPFLPFQNANISVEELHERAMQDSQNNNVDENSNDQQYDQYRNYGRQQFPAEQSVRPRVRRRQDTDETDRVPYPESSVRRRSSGNLTHRRNLSEGQVHSDPSSYGYEYDRNYPQLPGLPSSQG